MARKTQLNLLHTLAVTGLSQVTLNTITSSGNSREFREFSSADAAQIYLQIASVTGTNPKIVFEWDLVNPADDTAYAANPASDPIFNATGFATAQTTPLVSTIDPVYGQNYQVKWTVSGTGGPTFTGCSLVAVLLHRT